MECLWRFAKSSWEAAIPLYLPSFLEFWFKVVLVGDLTAKFQHQVGTRDAEEEARAEFTALITVDWGHNIEDSIDNRVNLVESCVDKFIIGKAEKHLHWGKNGVDLSQGVLIDLKVGAVIFSVTILCITQEESWLHSLKEVTVVVEAQIVLTEHWAG